MKSLLLLCLVFAFQLSFAADERIRIVGGPYVQMVGEHEASVVWVTNKKAQSWVEIAPDDQFNFYAEERPQFFQTYLGRKVTGTIHTIKITGLEKGTTYRYRIFSKEIREEAPYRVWYGDVATVARLDRRELSFTTLDSDKEEISFVVVNDIHGDNESLAALLENVEKERTDFVFFNGDMVSHMDSEKDLFEGFMNTVVKLFAARMPFYYSRGNHESRGIYASRYMDYFPTNTGKPYYCFREGPVFFVVLDGGEDKPDSDIEYHGTAAFDLYREEQAKWLQQVTESAEFRSAPFKVAVIHIPPFGSTWHGPLHTRKLFVPILDKAGIDLMLCGHLHQYQYIESGQEECSFPVLVNSVKEAAHIRANKEKMTMEIRDVAGKILHTFTYKVK